MTHSPISQRLRSAASVAFERLAWRRMEAMRVREDRVTAVRTFVYLFGLGATLVLISLLLPHSPPR